MPGGFCRISDRLDARAVSMGVGVRSADVWVIAEAPVEHVTLLPTDETVRIRRLMGNLPSRAADNLFWLGRYLERAEATLRLIRCLAGRMIDTDAQINPQRVVERIAGLFVAWGAVPAKRVAEPMRLAAIALHGEDEYGSALSLVRDAHRAASFIRERLSTDTWRLVDELAAGLDRQEETLRSEAEAIERSRCGSAGDRRHRRSRAGKHEPRRRLAFSRDRPQDRAGDQYLPFRPPFRSPPMRRPKISTSCSISSIRRSPIARAI